jgi:hypothetical protein
VARELGFDRTYLIYSNIGSDLSPVVTANSRHLSLALLASGAVAELIASFMGRYVTSQLNCPVFACSTTPAGALVQTLELIPLTLGAILLTTAAVLLARSALRQPRLREGYSGRASDR